MRQLNSKPFFRGKKQAWYCWIDGHLKSLGKKKREAWDRYRELIADRDRLDTGKPWTVRQCFDHYLEHAAGMKHNSERNRRQTFERFCSEAKVGGLPYPDLTVDHLEAWVKQHAEWSSSTRRSSINHVMAALNYCVKRKKIKENPIHGIKKPRWERRKGIISPADQQKIYDAAKGPFRDILTALRESGARPNEICSARVEDYRDGIIVLTEHKEDETGEDRTIYLSPTLRELVERLIGSRETGPIFRNSRGEPWTPDTIYCRFKRLRVKLGIADGAYPYAFRHRFASDAINASDANPALVARQLGHRGMEILMKNYFRENPEAMQRALAEITRRGS